MVIIVAEAAGHLPASTLLLINRILVCLKQEGTQPKELSRRSCSSKWPHPLVLGPEILEKMSFPKKRTKGPEEKATHLCLATFLLPGLQTQI